MIKKIAILTSGGDSPGMNNAIRAIVKAAIISKIEPYIVYEGYKGLYEGNIVSMLNIDMDQYIAKGGTFIYSSRFVEFQNREVAKQAQIQLEKKGIDVLIVIGGDGTYKGANLLYKLGTKIIALPATIDNDIASSQFTIGYDTALNNIVDAIDKIRDTMNSHHKIAIVEVMGRYCGDLALYSGIATGAEIIVTNKNKMSSKDMGKIVKEQMNYANKDSVIIIVSEFIYDDLKQLAKEVEKTSGIITRVIKLAYLQRGGIPTAQDRIRAFLIGQKAIEFIKQNQFNLAISLLNGDIVGIPITKALSMSKKLKTKKIFQINKLNQM